MNLLEQSRIILEGKEQLEEGAFMRLPGHVIGNELFTASRELAEILKSQKNGNDFDKKRVASLIKKLQDIQKEAKSFSEKDEVPVSYQYTKEDVDSSDDVLNESKIEFSIAPGEKLFGLYNKKGKPVDHAGSSVFGANSLKGILAHYSDHGAYMTVLALPKGSSYNIKGHPHSIKHLTDTEADQVFDYYKTASSVLDSVTQLLSKSENKLFADSKFESAISIAR